MNFLQEQIKRFKYPWQYSAFKLYFFLIVILIGGFGIGMTLWQELHKSSPNVNLISQSIATTFIALIAGSIIDLNLSPKILNIPSLLISSIFSLLLCVLCVLFAFNLDSAWSLIPALFGYLAALTVWVLANSENERLSDENYLQSIKSKVTSLESSLDDLD